jgi:hypothetical protein
MDASADGGGSSIIETFKKQKRVNNLNARSTAAAEDSPAGRHESLKCELPGLRAA